MVSKVLPEITAMEAESVASKFLADNLPDRFTAGEPRLDAGGETWRVPVLLAFPVLGPVGTVGEIVIGTDSKRILSHSPIQVIQEAASRVYEEHRKEIEAIVL